MDTHARIARQVFLDEIKRVIYLFEHEDREGAMAAYETLGNRIVQDGLCDKDDLLADLFLDIELLLYGDDASALNDVKASYNRICTTCHPKSSRGDQAAA